MTRPARLAAAAAALVLGVGAIFLGRAVLRERTSLARADAALAAPAPAVSVGRGGAAAGRVLGTGAAWDARHAAAAFARARADRALAVAVRDHVLAEQLLVPLAEHGPAVRRSWAATLVAVLEADQARLDPRTAKQHSADTLAALAAAVAADPRNEAAKRDLELLLTLQQRQGKSKQQRHTKTSAPKRHQQKLQRKATATLARAGSGW